MTRSELNKSINDFCETLKNEAQLISFEKKILGIYKGALLEYAKKQLDFIRSCIRNGINRPISIKTSQTKKTTKLETPKKLKEPKESKSAKAMPYRYMNKSYAEIAKMIHFDFDFLKSLIHSKNQTIDVEKNGLFTQQSWEILRKGISLKYATYPNNSGKSVSRKSKVTQPSKASVRTISGGLPGSGKRR